MLCTHSILVKNNNYYINSDYLINKLFSVFWLLIVYMEKIIGVCYEY